MAHYGSRDNPAVIREQDDLDRAVARVWHPTSAQATAGNYKMAHLVVCGLPVTIETPKNRMRQGVGPNGPWSVLMPCHYGSVKRTLGADGDAVDVYIGPHAHQSDVLPVWVIDQIDADSREFDEHKALVGFREPAMARQAYEAAFSDGRGRDRTGAVTRMTFDAFRRWLRTENTKKPLMYVKSASVIKSTQHYCPPSCSCRRRETGEHFMAATDSTSAGLGKLTSILGKALGRMTQEERSVIMADAAVSVGSALGKASDAIMAHGDDGVHPGRVEDQWDGPPDDHLETGGGHGPESTAAPGKVNVGPSQAASGNGAMKMEREYSRHAPQSGVQLATEKLGRDLAGMRGAMKSMIRAIEGINTQIETLKAGVAVVPEPVDVSKLVEAAVAKAMEKVTTGVTATVAKAVTTALAKAEKDSESGEEDEEEDEDSEAKESESGSGTEVEIVNEVDDEDEAESDEDDKKKKSAAKLRLMAKSRLKWAEVRLAKAIEHAEGNKPKSCATAYALAQINLTKAAGYIEAAKAINPHVGPKAKAVAKALVKVSKAIKAAPVDNQKNWPASTEKRMDAKKAVEPSDTGVSQADMQRAMAEIGKAVEGQGVLTAKMSQLFEAISGQSRNHSNGQPLPPVFSLAKASTDDLASREAEIIRMAETGKIRPNDVDMARDVISNIRARVLPENILSAKISRLAPAVQDVLTRQAA